MESHNGNCTLEDARNGKGPFVRLTIEKTKVAPLWLKESIYLWLPVGGRWQQLTDWPTPANEVVPIIDTREEADPAIKEDFASLPPDERDAIKFVFPRKGGIRRQQLQDKFGWSENKAMGILKNLMEQGFVIRKGEGKGCIYKPTE